MPDIMTDVFGSDLFNTLTLSRLVRKGEFTPMQMGSLNIFDPVPVNTRAIAIEYQNGKFAVVQSSAYGGPGQQYNVERRTALNFTIPHFQLESPMTADQIQGIRAAGSGSQLQTIQEQVVLRQQQMMRNMIGTHERLMLGAATGIVLDGDGSTLVNLFTQYGVTQTAEFAFDLTAASPASGAVNRKCNEVTRAIADALGDAQFTGVVGLAGRTFMDDLVANAEVRTSFERYQSTAPGLVAGFLREGHAYTPPFYWGGILWWEYRGNTDLIGTDKAIFFPIGVPDLYLIHFAPADFFETVNTAGLPFYAKVFPADLSNRTMTLHVQSNVLPICTRPEVLMKAKRGA